MVRLALFGAAPDTANMGVSALFSSTISGIGMHIDPVEFVVFDNGLGRRESIKKIVNGRVIRLIHFGARGGKAFYRPEHLGFMLLASKLGPLGARLNEGIRLIDSCDAVLDISGGDSFSDIYGRVRFNNIYRPKSIAVNRGKPLILLPQTYGPYKDPSVHKLAASIVRMATMAWARDEHSYQNLKDLLGPNYDPKRHLSGVDMAFGLKSSSADHLLDEKLKSWIEKKDHTIPLVGLNVSGLIYNDSVGASRKFGLKADYRNVVIGFLKKILKETTAHIVLISHVMDQPGHYESDEAACLDVVKKLEQEYINRVIVTPATLNESQVKWLIAHFDWFCGTRMHSTIAGLSSEVPTAAISYSDKTMGVFEKCGQLEHVMDLRSMGVDEIIHELSASLEKRNSTRKILPSYMSKVKKTAATDIQSISSRIQVR